MSPRTTLNALDVSDITRLFYLTQQLYAESVAAGGSRLYKDLYGKAGNYIFRIYGDIEAQKIKTTDDRQTYTYFRE